MCRRQRRKLQRRLGFQKKMSRHHRKCRSNGGTSHPSNISLVSRVAHNAFHIVFGSKNPDEICEELNRIWLDRAYRFTCQNIHPEMGHHD